MTPFLQFAKDLTLGHAELLMAERDLERRFRFSDFDREVKAMTPDEIEAALKQQRNVPEDSMGEKS